MPRFQLEIAAALAISVVSSIILFFLAREKTGKLRLPVHELGAVDALHALDPFDVTKPEDIIDGYPVDSDAFWAKMGRRKLFMSILLIFGSALEATFFVWSIRNKERQDIEIDGIQFGFSLYLLGISLRSVHQNRSNTHSESIIHITVLATLAVILWCFAAIIPSAPSPIISGAGKILDRLRLAVIGLYAIVSVRSITTPLGPRLFFPLERIYSKSTISASTNTDKDNVSGNIGASLWDLLCFSYISKIVWLSNTATSLEVGDLPILSADMRATYNYSQMKNAMLVIKLRILSWTPRPGSGWALAYRLLHLNAPVFLTEILLGWTAAILSYAPAFFLQKVVAYLETDPSRKNTTWGWTYVSGMVFSQVVFYLVAGRLWSLIQTTLQVRLRIQINTILFAKTLLRKDVASSASVDTSATEIYDEGFSSKAQIMTLMTTDVDRVSDFPTHAHALFSCPIEVVVGTALLYRLLGVSCFFGLAVTCLFLPINHYAGKVVLGAQENLMKARDERVGLTNEILAGIRMLKFMAWERSFEKRLLKIREKELKYQKLNYKVEIFWNAVWTGSPILVTLISFWHFAVIRQQILSPSIAFTSIMVFTEIRFALNILPETFINSLQTIVSLRRIEKYLNSSEISSIQFMEHRTHIIMFQSCTVTWPRDWAKADKASLTPTNKFVLMDLNLRFPLGKVSLVCGRLGSGKSLLLLALLGEADVLAGQVLSPRSPPDALATFASVIGPLSPEQWIVEGTCAYVPQTAWLRNASIKENILFSLPYDEARYRKTLEVCALVRDLEILEDGDESEIGERGVNLSGGQKARVSLARAMYSRASILLLDDVLSAVDAQTAHHLFNECLNGDLTRGRTVILVSHHVQLCVPAATYIVALDNGRVEFEGGRDAFQASEVMNRLVHSKGAASADDTDDTPPLPEMENLLSVVDNASTISGTSSAATSLPFDFKGEKLSARKVVEEEKRAVGRIARDIWKVYISACGNGWYWMIFSTLMIAAAVSPVAENGWLRHWSALSPNTDISSPVYYISVYASITTVGLVVTTVRWFSLYDGSIHASTVLYKRLLEAVLFASLRFHDTSSRGRLLNRFGKDFEGIDSHLSDDFGHAVMNGLSALTTLTTLSVIGGLPFVIAAIPIIILFYQVSKYYGQISRDMRRLDSVTRSPLYSMYDETISGVTVIRAFGASSKFLRDMLCCVDTNSNPYYWMWGVNRWMSARFNWLSGAIFGTIAVVTLITPSIDASLAAFALTFAHAIVAEMYYLVKRFVGLEQAMVSLERVKEYSDVAQEPPEFMEPRPPRTWPSKGAIQCQNLVIRYAPELPNVLHNLNFDILPGEKVGIIGRTGSGKSTLALSFFRFVEATEGNILIDGLNISHIGLTDLRSKLTIIPQDPTILSGSLRSTLDVFEEYEDAEIFEALRRVHLIPPEDTLGETLHTINANIFCNLDSSVSEGGENFSTGEKQLLCMARAILKRSKILVMDEATASVDYATDELIGKTIREEFADSTILTIAHRLRTVIDYDKIMLLSEGRIAEFDRPASLLKDPHSKFYSLCKATGKEEFSILRKMAGVL